MIGKKSIVVPFFPALYGVENPLTEKAMSSVIEMVREAGRSGAVDRAKKHLEGMPKILAKTYGETEATKRKIAIWLYWCLPWIRGGLLIEQFLGIGNNAHVSISQILFGSSSAVRKTGEFCKHCKQEILADRDFPLRLATPVYVSRIGNSYPYDRRYEGMCKKCSEWYYNKRAGEAKEEYDFDEGYVLHGPYPTDGWSWESKLRRQPRYRRTATPKPKVEEKPKVAVRNTKVMPLFLSSELKIRCAELKVMPYAEYLQTIEWQRCRARALALAEYHCQLCGEVSELHVHHNTYKNLGVERDSDLTVLCAACHELFHKNRKVK